MMKLARRCITPCASRHLCLEKGALRHPHEVPSISVIYTAIRLRVETKFRYTMNKPTHFQILLMADFFFLMVNRLSYGIHVEQ